MVNKIFLTLFLFALSSWAIGVSFPTAPVPTARFATGVSYDYYGGYMSYKESPLFLTEDIPFNMHGIVAFVTFAPVTFINLGFDMGIRDVNAFYAEELYNMADNLTGQFGFSGGAHLKFATPYFGDVFGIIAVGKWQSFYSEGNSDNTKWYYGDIPVNWSNSGDIITGAGGFSFHVKNFGYISFGAKYLDIYGEVKVSPAVIEKTKWSNDPMLGGWISADYFPRTNIKNYIPFLSFEVGFFPDSKAFTGGNPVLKNASFSVTIGGITNPLYGNSDKNWRP
jgi:hypothetical protein